MFSYPSGDKLHIGHWYNYGPVDSFARFLKMIKVPSLYLHGENDGCIGANLSEGMENFFDDLEIKILPNCAYFS